MTFRGRSWPWLTAALCAALLPACSSTEPGPAPTVTVTPPPATVTVTPPPRATEVVNVTAVDARGQVVKGYELEDESPDPDIEASQCSEPSGGGVTPNTYACGASLFNADACWRHEDGDLACIDLPWGTKLSRRSIDGDLPDTPKAELPQPIGLQLADGSRYRQRNGRASGQPPEGFIDTHYCVSGPCADGPGTATTAIVIGVDDDSVVNRESDTWLVLVGQMSDEPSGEAPEYQVVTRAWFIAAQ